jgi:hypothetical protein
VECARRLDPHNNLVSEAADPTADYQASLAQIPNGVGKVHGIQVGEAAAAAIQQLRRATAATPTSR